MEALGALPDPLARIRALYEDLHRGGQAPDGVAALLPDWALKEADFSCAAEEWIPWFQRRPPLWLRIQRADDESVVSELQSAGLRVERHPRLRRAVRVESERGIRLDDLPAYRNGAVEVQDLGSQAIGAVCAAAPGEQWWDACAGGGGKSLLLAGRTGPDGSVTASDVREPLLGEILRRARRGGLLNIRVRPWDGQSPCGPGDRFDGVLVDAPCTGSGTWRRNPADRWIRRGESVAAMAALQRQILRAAATGVKPYGRLVYATCSFLQSENERIVEGFLASDGAFQPERFAHPLTGEPCLGMACIRPWDGDCDAMFVARLNKKA
jgi:16S rRNA (cytosine967-C5)-methyltransferase